MLKKKNLTVSKEKYQSLLGKFRKIKVDFDKKENPIRILGVNYDITERKAIENSLFFLSKSSKILASSLDYNKTLKAVSSVAVPKIADWCSIDFINDDGSVELKAVSHVDPLKIKWAIRYRRQNPPNMKLNTGIAKVVKTGKSEFYPYVDPKLLQNLKPKDKKVIKKIGGLNAVIMVPLKNKKKVIGVMTLIISESKRRFSKLDLNIAEQIADRASVAIENASLYRNVNEERKRMSHLLYNVPGIVWERWINPNEERQRINFVSNYIEKMLGYSSDEWSNYLNFFHPKIVHPKDRSRVSSTYNIMLKTGKSGVIRARLIDKKGKVIWVESHVFVIKDDKGKSIGMRGVTMDITDRVEIERRKDEFITMASHELKTPLTSMKVFSHLLEKKLSKSDEMAPYLSRMDGQINKLTNLVNDLLDISKIQSGKLEIRRQEVNMKEFVGEVIDDMKLITNEVISLKEVDDENIFVDKERLSQVLINLISNAIKYSPPNTPVEIRAKVERGKVRFAISDKGYGISKEHQERIFERFYRVYDNVDRTYPGLGMGLYISNQIVKRHQGKMWLKSEKGKGSTFYFDLPSKLTN